MAWRGEERTYPVVWREPRAWLMWPGMFLTAVGGIAAVASMLWFWNAPHAMRFAMLNVIPLLVLWASGRFQRVRRGTLRVGPTTVASAASP